MWQYFIIWFCFSLVNVEAFVLGDRKAALRDRGHHSVGKLSHKPVADMRYSPLQLDDKHKSFETKISHRDHRKTKRRRKFRKTSYITTTQRIPVLTTHTKGTATDDSESTNEEEYNRLLDVYYEEIVDESKSKTHVKREDTTENGVLKFIKRMFLLDLSTEDCPQVERTQIGLKALYCLVRELNQSKEQSTKIAWEFWRIFRIWLCVYLAVAIPLFCGRGWCCCCLRCKFFKPHETISEAKRYIICNPPGSVDINQCFLYYEPTVDEVRNYERLQHFMKTL